MRFPSGDQLGQALVQLAFFLSRLQLCVVENADARAIVPTVFEPAKPFKNDGRCLLPADVTNDATHVELVPEVECLL